MKSIFTKIIFAILLLAGIWLIYINYISVIYYPKYIGKIFYIENNYLVERDLQTGNKKNIFEMYFKKKDVFTERSLYSLSANGSILAYQENVYESSGSSNNKKHLVVVDRIFSRTLLDMDLSKLNVSQISLSPDGKKVAIIAYKVHLNGKDGSNFLDVISIKSKRSIVNYHRIYSRWVGSPSWSPNSDRLASRDIWGKPIIISIPRLETIKLPGDGHPLWSPSGRYIAIGGE